MLQKKIQSTISLMATAGKSTKKLENCVNDVYRKVFYDFYFMYVFISFDV